MYSKRVAGAVCAALVASSLTARPSIAQTEPPVTPVPASASTVAATGQVFLPVVSRPFAPPDFTIIELEEGATVPGTFLFAVQAIDVEAISNVAFKVNGTLVATDTTPANGLQTLVDTSALAAGPAQLAATATGPGGQTTKTINVTVVKSFAASATVGTVGATLATTTGSTIALYPGAVPSGTLVSVQERTQQQVTDDTGIKWDDLGVTFLGAVQIQSGAPIQKPFGVTSAGFGNRVQPGQAVVTYRILPDQDGDGISELVAVNGASVAPNGTIVSSPIPDLLIQTVQVGGQAAVLRTQAVALSARPGQLLTLRGSGFNPISLNGNVAIFTSLVNGEQMRVPGVVRAESATSSAQLLKVVVPVLPVGKATLVVRNESLAAEVNLGEIDITAAATKQSPASPADNAAIVLGFIDRTETYLNSLTATNPESAAPLALARSQVATMRQQVTVLAGLSDSYAQDFLADAAIVVQNSGVLPATGRFSTRDLTPGEATRLGNVVSVYNFLAAAAALAAAVAVAAGVASTAPVVLALGIAAGAFWLASAALDLWGKYEQQGRPGCINMFSQFVNSLTGMGGAAPSGGPGCGSTNSGGAASGQLLAQVQGSAGVADAQAYTPVYVVKIFSQSLPRRLLTPFTGGTDPGGYFNIPILPEGEPFLAVATNKQTGASVTFTGTGKATGQPTYMFFDFSQARGNVFNISVGDTISDGVPVQGAGNLELPGGIDLYRFTATPGQRVFFDSQAFSANMGLTNWDLVDDSGATLFDSCIGCGDAGAVTLARGGIYTLTLGASNGTVTGTYRLKLWNVPAPQSFAINIGDTISNGVPSAGAGQIESPGAKDVYVFSATPGQQIFLDVRSVDGDLSLVNWRLVDAANTAVSSTCLGCGDPGVKTLTLGGVYTLTVGEDREDGVGAYSFTLWNVPPPQQFAISIGDTISNGVPSAGAGNIESPGVKDIYVFSATPGQQVFLDAQFIDAGLSLVNWKLVDTANTVVSDSCLGCGDPGVKTLTLGGVYTLTVGDNGDNGTGKYRFKIGNVPAPQQFAISIGDTISNGVPGAGAGNIESAGVKDVYVFTATPGQQVFLDVLSADPALSLVNWKLVDAASTVVFDGCLGCGDPGLKTLTLGGSYTLTVGDNGDAGTGMYSVQVRNP